jgi:hypothetical protein
MIIRSGVLKHRPPRMAISEALTQSLKKFEKWRARQDSNLRLLASEASTLSN